MSNINKGKLYLFTSYAPGAGKSYLMVERAAQQKAKGKKIIIGFLNSDHRDIDEILKDHHVRRHFHKKYSLKKILELRPDLVVMDELGMRGKNRDKKSFVYEDIGILLEHGIDVYTSANLKRFEQMNPQFKKISGIGIRTTIPDIFLEKAHRICFIDRSPKQMREDFQSGLLFDPEEMTSKIMQKNFQPETLETYRNLSLELLKNRYPDKLEIYER